MVSFLSPSSCWLWSLLKHDPEEGGRQGSVAGVVNALSGVKQVRDARDGVSIVWEILSPITKDLTVPVPWEAVGGWAGGGKEHDAGKL